MMSSRLDGNLQLLRLVLRWLMYIATVLRSEDDPKFRALKAETWSTFARLGLEKSAGNTHDYKPGSRKEPTK